MINRRCKARSIPKYCPVSTSDRILQVYFEVVGAEGYVEVSVSVWREGAAVS